MKGWGFEDNEWERFGAWLVNSDDRAMHRTQGVGGLRAGLRYDHGLALCGQDQDWLVRGATTHATQLALLDRIHGITEIEVMVLKGPEVACLYPEPAWRTSSDLDLFAVEADELWATLVGNGFAPTEPADRHDRHHHLVPLHLPGFRLGVEVHRRLGWPKGAVEPTPRALMANAVGSRVHPGFGALSPDAAFAHQLQHAWHGVPYGILRDLVDLAALWDQADEAKLRGYLEQARLDSIHDSTRLFARHVIAGTPQKAPRAARLVARPTLQRRSEDMRLTVVRRIAGMMDASGLGFATRSVAHDVAQVVTRRAEHRARRARPPVGDQG